MIDPHRAYFFISDLPKDDAEPGDLSARLKRLNAMFPGTWLAREDAADGNTVWVRWRLLGYRTSEAFDEAFQETGHTYYKQLMKAEFGRAEAVDHGKTVRNGKNVWDLVGGTRSFDNPADQLSSGKKPPTALQIAYIASGSAPDNSQQAPAPP